MNTDNESSAQSTNIGTTYLNRMTKNLQLQLQQNAEHLVEGRTILSKAFKTLWMRYYKPIVIVKEVLPCSTLVWGTTECS